MKILHVAESIRGGVGTILSSIASNSEKSELDLDYVLLVPRHQSQSLVGSFSENVEVVYFGGRNRLGRVISLTFALFRFFLTHSVDIVHLHSTFAGLIYRSVFFFRSSLIVYHPHGVAFDENRTLGVRRRIIIAIERILSGSTDCIIAISQYEADQLAAARISGNIVVVENGVAPSNVAVNFEENDRSGYLFVGRFDPQKGLDSLLTFWRSVDENKQLFIAGEAVIKEESSMSRSLENVVELGWLGPEALNQRIAQSIAVIVPSRWEGFGLVVVEAFRNATPVIASDRGALPFLVRNGSTGFVFNYSDFDAELNIAIGKLESSNWESLARSAYAEYVARFQEMKMINGIFAIYHSILH